MSDYAKFKKLPGGGSMVVYKTTINNILKIAGWIHANVTETKKRFNISEIKKGTGINNTNSIRWALAVDHMIFSKKERFFNLQAKYKGKINQLVSLNTAKRK